MNRRSHIANQIKANLHIVDGSVWMPYIKEGDGEYIVRLLEVTPLRRVYYDGETWISREMEDTDPVPESAQFVGYAGKNKDEEAPWLVTDEEAEVGSQMSSMKTENTGWGEWSIDPRLESDDAVVSHVAGLFSYELEDADQILEEIRFLALGTGMYYEELDRNQELEDDDSLR